MQTCAGLCNSSLGSSQPKAAEHWDKHVGCMTFTTALQALCKFSYVCMPNDVVDSSAASLQESQGCNFCFLCNWHVVCMGFFSQSKKHACVGFKEFLLSFIVKHGTDNRRWSKILKDKAHPAWSEPP